MLGSWWLDDVVDEWVGGRCEATARGSRPGRMVTGVAAEGAHNVRPPHLMQCPFTEATLTLWLPCVLLPVVLLRLGW